MGLRILTNTASIAAQHQLARSTASLARDTRHLATGLRIETAADDVAGSAMAARLRARVRSVEQNRRNANDGMSLVHAAEGALEEATAMVHRLRELAVQVQSGTIGANDRQTLSSEFDAVIAEINRIGDATTFGGVQVFGDSEAFIAFHVGPGTTVHDVITVALPVLHSDLTLIQPESPPEPAVDGMEPGGGGQTPVTAQIDALLQSITEMRSRFGAAENRLSHIVSLLGRSAEDGSSALSRVEDVDLAAATADLARHRIAVDAGIAVLGQANVQPELALRLLQ